MTRSSTYQDRWNELVSLLWCALGQQHAIDGLIDEQTYQFFLLPTTPSLHFPQSQTAPVPPSIPPLPEKQRGIDPYLKAQPSPIQKTASTLTPQEEEPMDPNVDSSEQKLNRKLEKLLPRPFSPQPVDITSTRKQLSSSTSIPHLSSVSLYENPASHLAKNHWSIFSYLPSASPPTPKEIFINSVVKALSERLNIQVSLYSCYDPSFGLHLPIAVDDSDVVIFFIDSHLQSALDSMLASVQTFTASPQLIETPFSLLGTVHGRPLRAFILHATTHEDASLKSALWHSLKTLATLTPPQ